MTNTTDLDRLLEIDSIKNGYTDGFENELTESEKLEYQSLYEKLKNAEHIVHLCFPSKMWNDVKDCVDYIAELHRNQKSSMIVKQLQVDLKDCFERARSIAKRLQRNEIHEFDSLFGNSSDGWELAIQNKADYISEKLHIDLEQAYKNHLQSILKEPK